MRGCKFCEVVGFAKSSLRLQILLSVGFAKSSIRLRIMWSVGA